MEVARVKLEQVKQKTHELAVAQSDLRFEDESAKIRSQIVALDGYSTAVLEGADALRKFNIEQQVQAFARNNPLVGADKLDEMRAQLTVLTDIQNQAATAQHVHSSRVSRGTTPISRR